MELTESLNHFCHLRIKEGVNDSFGDIRANVLFIVNASVSLLSFGKAGNGLCGFRIFDFEE